MTKREREQIKKAIRLLYEEDGWEAGMRILMPMAGLRGVPTMDLDSTAEPVSVQDALRRARETEPAP